MTTREWKYTKMHALSAWQKWKELRKQRKAERIAKYANEMEGL